MHKREAFYFLVFILAHNQINQKLYVSFLDLLINWPNFDLAAKWSDDAETNSLLQNRGSIWIQSVTISTPSNEMNSVDNTCVISIGPKEGNHDFVEKIQQGHL